MKNFFEKNKKTVLLFLGGILFFPLVILCPSSVGIIPRDIGIAIVGYGGAILGGFLTLYGVWWTIEDNNRNRKKELALQYCPILTADIIEPDKPITQLCSEMIVLYGHPYFDDSDLKYTKNLIRICNVGRGEIQRTRLRLEECRILAAGSFDEAEQMDLSGSYILSDGIFQFIPINGAFYLYVGLPSLKPEYYGQIKKEANIRLELSLEIAIEGAFSMEEQIYRLHFFMDVPLRKNVEECRFDSMTFMRME